MCLYLCIYGGREQKFKGLNRHMLAEMKIKSAVEQKCREKIPQHTHIHLVTHTHTRRRKNNNEIESKWQAPSLSRYAMQ